MAVVNLSLAELFRRAFGTTSAAFEQDLKFDKVAKQDLQKKGRYGADYYAIDSLTGREWYLPMTISYVPLGSNGQWQVLPLSHPVVRLTMEKNIIKTPLTERAGTVKELINIKDCEINVRGLLISDDGELPEDGMYALQAAFASERPVLVNNVLTDIALKECEYYAVIESLNFPEVQGVKHVRGYELKMVSNSVFNLEEV